LQEESGGKADNTLALTVPTMASDSVFVRLRPSRKNVRGETRAGPIHITH